MYSRLLDLHILLILKYYEVYVYEVPIKLCVNYNQYYNIHKNK